MREYAYSKELREIKKAPGITPRGFLFIAAGLVPNL